jgi:hypothetical protein
MERFLWFIVDLTVQGYLYSPLVIFVEFCWQIYYNNGLEDFSTKNLSSLL